ncbi:MAG: iron-containing redox enzyme family protein [Alphaproteobacteria bacterium]
MELYIEQLEVELKALVEKVKTHSFLQRCQDGSVALDELKIFLVQQGLYATNFTKYLCATMSNLPSNAEIRPLAQNLFDESGFSGTKPHAVIYDEMLENFGLSLKGAVPLSGTVKLINEMFRHCRNENPALGTGALCLGAEAIVPFVYTDIVKGFTQCGVNEDQLEFFTLHITVDDEHATTMGEIMASIAKDKPEQIANMVAAGRTLVDARMEFFTSIEEAAKNISAAG